VSLNPKASTHHQADAPQDRRDSTGQKDAEVSDQLWVLQQQVHCLQTA